MNRDSYTDGIGALAGAFFEEQGRGLHTGGALTSSRAGAPAVGLALVTFNDALTNLADVDRLINTLAGDIQANPSVTPAFKTQWEAFYAEWKAFFTFHNSAAGRAKMAFSWEGPAQVYAQTEAYRSKLRSMTEAYKREPGAKPTIPEVPVSPVTPPSEAAPFPWKWVLIVTGIGVVGFIGWRAYKAGQYAAQKKRYLEENVVPAILEARGGPGASRLLLTEDV